LAAAGLNTSDIAFVSGLPRSTVRDWLVMPRRHKPWEPADYDLSSLPGAEYSYLLGFYLGDGTVSAAKRGVYRLRIATDGRYPRIIAECVTAMRAVMPGNRVLVQQQRSRAVEISCYSKAWPVLLPQHGPGRKHARKIELVPWQETILERHAREFIRGLIHSDGCRVLNRVNGKDYPRYFFSQVSDDIRRLFCRACSDLGIEYTLNRPNSVSIARRGSVALLDSFVGPKS
jgi:hypothetical protein